MDTKKIILKYIILLIFNILILITLVRIIIYLGLVNQKEIETFNENIYKCTQKKIDFQNDYNLCFIITPDDCTCFDLHLSREFINEIKELYYLRHKKVSFTYIVTGKYLENEKIAFVENVVKESDVFLDRKNKMRKYLFKKFGFSSTPFLVIFNREGRIKYWQGFNVETGTDSLTVKNDLFNLLSSIK
jgi:hypothetical protein